MTVTLIGPRSSTPKSIRRHNGSRNLPTIPKIQLNEPVKGRKGRLLPQPPATTRPAETLKLSPRALNQTKRSLDVSCRVSPKLSNDGNNVRFSRSLPRVPRPLASLAHSPSQTSRNTRTENLAQSSKEINQFAVPLIPKQPRQLPKLPVTGRKEQKFYLYDVYKGEGDVFLRKGEYEKALESYNSALKLVPEDIPVLVARSRCHRMMGRNRKAIQDAEMALNMDPLCPEALFQKAEALYADRNYEMALVFYTKGSKQKPDVKAFHQGMDKAQHALNNSASGRYRKMTQAGDQSLFIKKKHRQQQAKAMNDFDDANADERSVRLQRAQLSSKERREQRSTPDQCVPHKTETAKAPEPEVDENVITERRMKEILGRMYKDKKYLEKLIEQTGELPRGSVDLTTMAENGLNFLYERVLYWVRQGRIIPPEAPGSRPSLSRTTGNTPLSARSNFSKDSRVRKLHKELTGTKAADPIAPGSWFRYLDRKKAVEATNRKLHRNKQCLLVLEGQKLAIKENRPLSPLRKTKKKDSLSLKETKKRYTNKSREKETSMTSESDSGLNISFSTYRMPSDVDQPSDSNEDGLHRQIIREESPSPGKFLSPHKNNRKLRYMKKAKGQQDAIRRESMTSYITKSMEDIENEYVEANYQACAKKANACLNVLHSYREEDVPNVMGMVSKLHSYIGNAAIETRDYGTALEHHQKDLLIGEECNDEEATSRALGNLGRIFVFQNKHQKALELFSRKVPMCKTRMETAWLYHEIGNCFLVLSQYEYAKEAARRSIEAAEEALEWNYQLQSCVLLGVAEVKLRQYHVAFNTFEKAMDQARMQGDSKAESAIRDALNDVNDRIVEEMKLRTKSQQDFIRSRSRSDFNRSISRAEWSDYSSIFIPEDDGDVSLTETGYDTDNLHIDLDNLRTDFETPMLESLVQMTSEGLSEQIPHDLKKSLQSLASISRQSDVNFVMRSNTALG